MIKRITVFAVLFALVFVSFGARPVSAAPLSSVCRYTAYGAWWDTDRDGIHDPGENYVMEGTLVLESTSSEDEMPPLPTQHAVVGTQGSWNGTTCVYDHSTVYIDLSWKSYFGAQRCIWLNGYASNAVWLTVTRSGSVSQIAQYVGVNYCQ